MTMVFIKKLTNIVLKMIGKGSRNCIQKNLSLVIQSKKQNEVDEVGE
jgi:hypothetical protein